MQRERLIVSGEPIGASTRALAAFYDKVHLGTGWAGELSGLVAVLAFLALTAALMGSVGLWRRRRR
jgi:hypothetical protein